MFGLTKTLPRISILVAAVCALPAYATNYDITTVSRPGAFLTQIFDVNNAGQIVGWSTETANSGAEAFIYSAGAFTALTGPTGSISTNALGISDTGIVVGDFSTTSSVDSGGNVVFGPAQSFIFNGSDYTTFAVAGATDTFARAISPDGRYISGYYDSATVLGQGFILDTLTNTFTFVGAGGNDFTIAQGINSSDVMVGGDIQVGPPTTRPGFIYDIGTAMLTDVLLPGTTRTSFRSIDDSGIISGWYVDPSGTHGFTGYPGAFQTVDVAGVDNTFVEGSNNSQVLVGNFSVGDVSGAFIATPVSVAEPKTLALIGIGFAAMFFVRKQQALAK